MDELRELHLGRPRLDAGAPRASEQLRAAFDAAMRDDTGKPPTSPGVAATVQENTARPRLGSLWAVAEPGEGPPALARPAIPDVRGQRRMQHLYRLHAE
jgi:hypothetical protein